MREYRHWKGPYADQYPYVIAPSRLRSPVAPKLRPPTQREGRLASPFTRQSPVRLLHLRHLGLVEAALLDEAAVDLRSGAAEHRVGERALDGGGERGGIMHGHEEAVLAIADP